MKIKVDKVFIISTLLCFAPMLLSFFMYEKLPEQVPIHWNSNGVADNFASKEFATFAMPLIMAGFNTFLYFMMNNDPKKPSYPKVLKMIVQWIIPVMSLVVVPISLFTALGVEIDLNVYSPIFLGVSLIIIGNYLPKTKQNYTIGIKISWTLNSEENWNKTHRLAGYVWVIGGVGIVLTSGFNTKAYPICTAILIALVTIPIIYSYLLYKKGI